MPDVVLVTGRRMPVPDPETPLLVAALAERGIEAAVRPWGPGTDWAAAPLVVVRTPWDYTLARAAFLAWAAQVDRSTLLVNPTDVLRWNSHKGYLLELARAGVATLPTVMVPAGASASLRAEALARCGGEVVIKPAVSAGAFGALRAASGSAVAATHLAGLAADGDALVQPLATSVLTEGEVSLVYLAGRLSHAVRKIPAAGDFRVHAEYGGQVVPHAPTPEELAIAAAALRTVPGPIAYGRVDLVNRGGHPAVMELELIEPELFLTRDPAAAARFADHLTTLLPGLHRT